MELKVLSVDYSKTVGFVKVEEFIGVTARFRVSMLDELAKFLQTLRKLGINSVDIGLEDDGPLLVFFGDNRDVAFAVAPMIKKDDEEEDEE